MTALLTPPHSTTPAPVAPPPAVQPPPRPFRWTLERYRDLDQIHFFDDQRTMLLDGEIYVMPNPKPPHSTALGLVDLWARVAFATGHWVRVQMPFDIRPDSEPNPDVAVVVGSVRDYATADPTTAELVVEVADSSLFTDTTTKAEKYATAKVPDYWVIDLENRQLIVFRDPAPLPAALGANAYRQRTTHGPADTVAPLTVPAAVVRVADLLP